uniref:Reverse transcriptase/retrotransposon-derived protein RNase H-like domain-containing protein n=1 Tax=Brassica oleracea var. oleracea TaxID=109376 RepID=A0A0D3A0J7_BRAOL
MVKEGIMRGHKISEKGIELKDKLVSAPIVQPPDSDFPFEIMCDASDYAVGA